MMQSPSSKHLERSYATFVIVANLTNDPTDDKHILINCGYRMHVIIALNLAYDAIARKQALLINCEKFVEPMAND